MELGPVQLLVLGFTGGEFKGEIRAELDRLREHDVVRVLDVAAVRKDSDGNIERLQLSDLSVEEAEELGAYAGALLGFGVGGDEETAEAGAVLGIGAGADGHILTDDMDHWYIDDAIPPDTAAAVALLEHRWAIPLRESIRNANGVLLAEAWVHPQDLVAIGLVAAVAAESS
jgi:uncharacterized membrane protein